jgi:hypothetical protein
MKILNALIAGLAGAVVVTIAHELIRKNDPDAPRLDLLGEEALGKVIRATGADVPVKAKLYAPALTADVLSNAFYYGLSTVRAKNPLMAGLFAGASAGLGAIKLPRRLGLDLSHTDGSTHKKGVTMGLYTLGGILTGIIVRRFGNRQ